MTIEFGNRLQELRKAHGLSQEDLADKLGVSRQAVSKWECGEASPDTDNLIQLSKIYGISLDELVGNAPTMKSNPEKVEIVDDEGQRVTITEHEIIAHTKKGKKVIVSDKDDDDDEEQEKLSDMKKHPVYTKINIVVSSISTFAILITYILLGTFLGLWGQAWVLFLLIPIIPGLMDLCFYRKMSRFPFPVLVAFVYLLICMWWPGGLWHPWWVIFLTIPVYYIIADMIKKLRKVDQEAKENKDNE